MKVPLSRLQAGQQGQVVAIDSQDGDRLLKLAALGLVPGSVVRLEQRFPAYILRVGETVLTLDEPVARDILLVIDPDEWA